MSNTGAKRQPETDREKRDQPEKGYGEHKQGSQQSQFPRGSEQGGQRHNPGQHGGHGEHGSQTESGSESDASKKTQEQRNNRKKDRDQRNK
jgi:hypothetical protein